MSRGWTANSAALQFYLWCSNDLFARWTMIVYNELKGPSLIQFHDTWINTIYNSTASTERFSVAVCFSIWIINQFYISTLMTIRQSNFFIHVCLWVNWKRVCSRKPNLKSWDCKNIRFKSFNTELYLFVIILVEYIKLKFVYCLIKFMNIQYHNILITTYFFV